MVLVVAAFLFVRPATLLYFADYWEHRAVVQEVIRHGTALHDPIYGETATSRQFTPWSLALGFLARVLDLSVDQVLAFGAVLVSALFLFGVFDFGRTYYKHALAPTILLGWIDIQDSQTI